MMDELDENPSLDGMMDRTVLLDLETTRSGRIRHLGAVFRNSVFEVRKGAGSRAVLEQLDRFAREADYVLGHNLLGHDFPVLQGLRPGLRILSKPLIDTLYLSPLAFPENPYHRLVKDYKLVRAARNDPLADARLAGSVFGDQWAKFGELARRGADLLDFFSYCFRESTLGAFSGVGLAAVLTRFAPRKIHSPGEALNCFRTYSSGKVCGQGIEEQLPKVLVPGESRPAAAYALAWLQVAGGNSVLPPWVRHRFPEIPILLKALRETPCGKAACAYCRESHDPERQLARFFGYPGFRPAPSTPEGQSLQRAIVRDCLGDQPVLGILPTGGGKSLCYQLPALVRYQHRGTLTVVISPLQALMKDQVDNLVQRTGTLFAEAVYGLQTPPERGEVLERVRLGNTAILYISPEQLRSVSIRNGLKQREIGCWVFDEAHCLSKWGHDFRPDYLYAARFIAEFTRQENQPLAPVCCFTATAKSSVIQEIQAHFREVLGQELICFAGGVERDNLTFEVIAVGAAEKLEKTRDLIVEALEVNTEPAGIIVYAATRSATEEIRDFLHHQGLVAEAFHAGLEAQAKREIIEAFTAGRIPVICATNAFGMGIDKENIRLVLHYEMPGSLENYIQEAGRAGRDLKPARCVLLYDPNDADRQFQMGAMSEIQHREIARILRALRRKTRNPQGDIVVTSDELLRDEELAELHSLQPDQRDTKLKAALAWLERAGFLKRNQNLTDIFQGKPRVDSLAAAEKVIAGLNLSPETRSLWGHILAYLINRSEARGMRADAIAEALFPQKELLLNMERQSGLTAAQVVLRALHQMAEAGLIDQGMMLSAVLRPQGKNSALKVFAAICEIENQMVAILQAEDPDAELGDWVALNIRRLNQQLSNEGYASSPDLLRRLIKGISYDGKGFAASQGSFELRYIDRQRYQVRLQRSWQTIRGTISLRQRVAHVILQDLVARGKTAATEKEEKAAGPVRVDVTTNELAAAIKADLTLSTEVKRILPAIDRALMFLHEQKVITLQGGLAILRQAMTLHLDPAATGRRYSRGDFKPLALHYREKRLQVHVMMRYAALALEKLALAIALVLDYFSLGRIKFINTYFKGDQALLDTATTAETYRRIVENLRNPVQIAAVGSPPDQNLLILAGPGSGKTTVIVHRVAYLLAVERVAARRILVLCFNHSSAVMLRKRLNTLAGKAARGVMVATYHGAAMALAGISLGEMRKACPLAPIDFDRILQEAIEQVKGGKEIPGMAADEARERLLAGYSHILVDEYQDIDEAQYELVSVIAGRTLKEDEGRLSLTAVGDDDQNIYTFRGANLRFIRKFQEDYRTRAVYLTENYRSSRHIIAAANALIHHNRDRMKGRHPIRINHDRQADPPGGRWSRLDPLAQGRVQVVTAINPGHQAAYVQSEINRLRKLDPGFKWENVAILARTKTPLAAVRTGLEAAGHPFRRTLDQGLPLHRVREIRRTLDWLGEKRGETCRASDLRAQLDAFKAEDPPTIWWRLMEDFFSAYREESADSLLPVQWARDQLFEFTAEQRREKVVGEGIFLGTIHGAKGMEFPHVFILDGDWRRPREKDRWEEERRVMYVGMTRAEETLCLLKIPPRANPFLSEIQGDFLFPRVASRGADLGSPPENRYALVGLNEIYLDYGGCFAADHPIHRHLARLAAGDRVGFHPKGPKIEVRDSRGACIARLSGEGVRRWRAYLDRIVEVRVVALLGRTREDPDEPYTHRIQAQTWELPVLEVVYRPPLQGLEEGNR